MHPLGVSVEDITRRVDSKRRRVRPPTGRDLRSILLQRDTILGPKKLNTVNIGRHGVSRPKIK